jgi:hypothetical protein
MNIQIIITDYFLNASSIFASDLCDKIPHGAYLGSDLKLDTYETHFNEDLMATKHQELAQAFYSSDFPPAKTFYKGKKIHIPRLKNFCSIF